VKVSGVRALFVVAIVSLPMLASAATSSAKTIHKSAPTGQERSVNRAADGTITLEGRYTSPNPHCLEKKRWKTLSDGNYHEGFDAYPVFNGGIGTAPNGGWLAPVSPFGRSPLVWKAVWPGTASSYLLSGEDSGKKVLISETDLVKFFYWIPHSGTPGLPKKAYYTTYKEHGNTIELTCGVKSNDHNWTYPL
jgi:hypothetical protein